ncbi:MAG TPA: methionyl-tRNA formyltransferase, partial [Polyangiaceae bacterium]|nr:methionyl-tRNA formyltransferase [Polyangiaceae bacterium]
MRALFFGTPAIAVPSLLALGEIGEIAAVVCQPDRPAGRGLALRAPAVKEAALERGWHVEQPTKVRTPEFAEWVANQRADVAVVIAYGRILPKAVLDAPRAGCINVHGSLLPHWRGAAPIQWSVASGDTETGVTLMQMDEGL